MKWITRERPKIDRIACPWLIARFIDPTPEFLYVPAGQVLAAAQRPAPFRTTSRASSCRMSASFAASMRFSCATR